MQPSVACTATITGKTPRSKKLWQLRSMSSQPGGSRAGSRREESKGKEESRGRGSMMGGTRKGGMHKGTLRQQAPNLRPAKGPREA